MYSAGCEEQGAAAAAGQQRPAFSVAEKRLQLHRDQLFTEGRNGRRRAAGFSTRPIDLSGVLELQPGVPPPPGVSALGPLPPAAGLPPTAAAFALAAHPGLLVLRGALSPALQRQLVVDALTRYVEAPNTTTHARAYPAGLPPGLWEAVQRGLRLQQPQEQLPAAGAESGAAAGGSGRGTWGEGGSGPTAASLLRKLRWSTLGPPYDWTHRLYTPDAPHQPLPEQLRQLAGTLAGLAAALLPSSGEGQEQQQQQQQQQQQEQGAASFSPDAALVNFYFEGDTLNGHLDDAERRLSQPLVSLSLGCDAVFLLGGETKAVPPTALLLRSGDVLVLSGHARRCYHGLPRIFTDRPLAPALCCRGGGGGDGCSGNGGSGDRDGQHSVAGAGCTADAAFEPFARHMRTCRISISIRDTR